MSFHKKSGEKKLESIEATDADIVVTACPGCQFQLLDGIVRLKKPQKVMSLMEVLKLIADFGDTLQAAPMQ